MINWFFNQKKQEARKAARDAKLKEELSAKVRALETSIKQELLDFTEVTVNGKRQRVYVDRITVIDVSPLNRG